MERHVRLAHTKFGAGSAPASLAIELGFLSDLDISVERQELASPGAVADAVVNRSVDVGVCGGSAVIAAALKGGDPLIVRSIEAENVYAVIGARDVTSPQTLKGRIVGVLGRDQVDGIIITRALRDWGLDPESDVSFETRENRGALWDALNRGEIAAMSASIPQPILARKVGLPILRDFHDDHEPFQLGSFMTSRTFAEESPELLTDFMRGIERGIETFIGDFALALPHLKARSKLDDEDVLRETHRLFAEALGQPGPSLDALQAVADVLFGPEGGAGAVDLTNLIDGSFAAVGQ